MFGSGRRKPCIRLASQMIGGKADPFVHRIVEHRQLIEREIGELKVALVAIGPIVDRIRRHLEADLAENPHGTRHMPGRGHEKPDFAGLRIDERFGEQRVFPSVAGFVLENDLIGGDAERLPQRARRRGFGKALIADIGRTAGEDEPRVRIFMRERGAGEEPARQPAARSGPRARA